jgi:AraC-like DNA-binding protein
MRLKNRILVSKIEKKNTSTRYESSSELSDHILPLVDLLNEIKTEESYILQESLTLEKLAKKLNTNRSYLSEAINLGFNSTFSQWINQIRIDKACELLSDPSNDKYSFETIAKMAGFTSISSFNTNFKRITGITPSYFKNHRLLN